MSTPPTPPAPPGVPVTPGAAARREITLISHSPLFYWWPIWFLGFIMALITWVENNRLAIIPSGAKVSEVARTDQTTEYRLVAPNPPTKSLTEAVTATGDPTV